MKKVIFSILTVLILFVLQSSLFHYLAFNNIVPNLLLIAVCFYGYKRGENSGIIAGFFCGLLLDIFYAEYLGFNSLLLLFIGFFNGLLNHFYIDETTKIPIVCVAGSNLLYSFVTYGLKFLLNGKFSFDYYFLNVIFPELIYTTVIALILYPGLNLIETKLIPVKEEKEESEDVI